MSPIAPYSKYLFIRIVIALTKDKNKILASTFQCKFGVGSMNVVRFRQKTALYEKHKALVRFFSKTIRIYFNKM